MEAGEIVALPTETVYGLAARADSPEAISRLRSLKQRPEQMPLTWHIAPEEIDASLRAYGEKLPLGGLAARLAGCYWPGPITLVLQGIPAGLEAVAEAGFVGVRCPAHPFTEGVLKAADFPIVMTSANLHGDAPALDADTVAATFTGADELALIIDGGDSQTRGASSVLKLGFGHFELLRLGLLSIEDLRGAAGLRIGFTCTGNTCRSPLAEGLARLALSRALSGGSLLFPSNKAEFAAAKSATNCDPADFGFELSSMGVAAHPGSPASQGSLVAAAEYGLDLSKHQSQRASIESIEELDVIYGLTHSHAAALVGSLPPELAERVDVLHPESFDISDPIGGPIEIYRDTAEQIAGSIEARIEQWL
jgi:tRNA threonylcarbamoyl adenosine modification protein (Sua5/YciO/YrdC/YwlC family)